VNALVYYWIHSGTLTDAACLGQFGDRTVIELFTGSFLYWLFCARASGMHSAVG